MESAPMEYLIRLAQMHETFRRPELEALAVLHNVDLEILEYSDQVREDWQILSFFSFADIFFFDTDGDILAINEVGSWKCFKTCQNFV
jgi:tRNA G10  N-methylase Trm11